MKFRNLLVLTLVITLISCGQKNEQQEVTQQYKLIKISTQNVTLSNTQSASIRGRQDIKIIPRVEGHLTDVGVTEGSKVKAGQILFAIDQIPYKSQLQAAQASTAVCKASVATAKLTFASKQNLYKKNIISEFELVSAENALKVAEAQLKQALALEVAAQNNLSYTVIKSPSDGVIGKLPYRKGDFVNPSIQDGLTIVADNAQMYVYFSMSEQQVLDLIQQYEDMETAIASMPAVQLKLSNQTIYPHSGKIESISGIVDASTGAVSVRAAFPNKEGKLLSGGAGSIILPYIHNNVVVIPQEATFEVQDKTYVYKVINGVTSATIISVDKINNGTEYIVTEGLKTGDLIIGEGAGLVREGISVKEKE